MRVVPKQPPESSGADAIRRVTDHRLALSTGAIAIGAFAFGALAMGAVAIGALAIGRLAIGRLRLRDARIDKLSVGTLEIADRSETPAPLLPEPDVPATHDRAAAPDQNYTST